MSGNDNQFDAIPRAKIQRAMERIRGWQARQVLTYQQHGFLYHKGTSEALARALDIIAEECGVSEVQS